MDNVLIWDDESAPPVCDGTVVLWRSFADSAETKLISVPALVEANADLLRSRYLTWVQEFGETPIRGRRIVDHLEMRPDFSFWWMTLFAEKCNYSKSPQIDDVIRLLAFEQWVDECCPTAITLISANAELAECMASLCQSVGISFSWQSRPTLKQSVSWTRRLYQKLPYLLQSLVWLLVYAFRRWPLRGSGLAEWRRSKAKITFFSFLFKQPPQFAEGGRFESRYWGHLPEELIKDGIVTNWLHIYAENDTLPCAADAADAISQFNSAGEGKQIHVTLDSFLTLKILFKIVHEFFYVWRMGRKLMPAHSESKITKIDLWPLYRVEWKRSFSGPLAMSSVLNLNLLECATNYLNIQQVGVYLQENQAWEFALVYAWKAAGHRRLIGFPHSTVRFWDLRYFFSPRNYIDDDSNGLPKPEQIAVSGLAVKDALIAGGYPEDRLVMVESLRYFHLLNSGNGHRIRQQIDFPFHVLVMTDILEKNTDRQVRLLEASSQFLPADTIYTVKPHPAGSFDPDKYPRIRVKVSKKPISDLLSDCHVAYSSSVTSATIDAYCAGIPVVSMLDPSTLNLSPLRGYTGAVFASTPKELAEALVVCATQQLPENPSFRLFNLDVDLPRWRKLLHV